MKQIRWLPRLRKRNALNLCVAVAVVVVVLLNFGLPSPTRSNIQSNNFPKRNMMANEAYQRLVHLDLKGAPPRLEYLAELLPFVKRMGATGILIEYEDTFPFSGELVSLRAPYAYSTDDVKRILAIAKDCGLSVIPLVQTFGHFEFVLKHDRFVSLREVQDQPFAVCPRNNHSMPLIREMLDQILRLHPDVASIHIGADEVWNLASCDICKSWINDWSKGRDSTSSPTDARDALFIDHVISVANYVKEKYPTVHPIMWDDMFRDTSLQVLRDSQIGKVVTPMVWRYTPTLDFAQDLWDKYAAVFDTVWIASAFKGATGSNQYVTDAGFHIENHLAWLGIVQKEASKFKNGVAGIALTGWQRYDHFAGLCETLPIAIPSLVLCLQTFLRGEFSEGMMEQVAHQLGFSGGMPIRAFPRPIAIHPLSKLNFPGSPIYEGLNSLANFDAQYHPFVHGDSLDTWFNPYHVRRNFTNPFRVKQYAVVMNDLLQNYTEIWRKLNVALQKTFFPDTVDEIHATLFLPKIKKLEDLLSEAKRQVVIGGRAGPKYPIEQEENVEGKVT